MMRGPLVPSWFAQSSRPGWVTWSTQSALPEWFDESKERILRHLSRTVCPSPHRTIRGARIVQTMQPMQGAMPARTMLELTGLVLGRTS